MIKDLFAIPELGMNLSGGQKSFLRMLASVPGAKELMGDAVTDEDKAMASEAMDIIEEFTDRQR